MVTGEMLLNGDGQLHEGDWGGIGEDGDYEAGESGKCSAKRSLSQSSSGVIPKVAIIASYTCVSYLH